MISCVPTSGQCGWPAQPRHRRQSPFFSLQLPIVTTVGSVMLCCRSGFRTLQTENTRPARPDERCCAIVISRRSRTARTVPTYTSSMARSRTTSDYVACSKRSSNWRRVRRSNADALLRTASYCRIAVNSRSAPATDWDQKPAPPSIVSQLIQASSVPIDHFSFESVELLRDIAARWADQREPAIARRLDAGIADRGRGIRAEDYIRCDQRQL